MNTYCTYVLYLCIIGIIIKCNNLFKNELLYTLKSSHLSTYLSYGGEYVIIITIISIIEI